MSYHNLSISEIKKEMNKLNHGMDDMRRNYNSLYSEYEKLSDTLNEKRMEFFDIKVGDIIEFDNSFRIGKYGFINEKIIKIEISKITDKFVKGVVRKGELVIFKGKKNDNYEYTIMRKFNVRKLNFIEKMSTNSISGRILDRDSEIDNILNIK